MTEPLLAGLDEDALLGVLPPSVANNIRMLDLQNAPWDQIGEVLAGVPMSGVALKGPGNWTGRLWQSAKTEFHSFLCTDSEAYSDLRTEWDGLRKKGTPVAVASLSGVIGAQLGVASGVVAPLVIWTVVVALRIGKESVCSAFAPAQDGQAALDEPPPA